MKNLISLMFAVLMTTSFVNAQPNPFQAHYAWAMAYVNSLNSYCVSNIVNLSKYSDCTENECYEDCMQKDFQSALQKTGFQKELHELLRDYAGQGYNFGIGVRLFFSEDEASVAKAQRIKEITEDPQSYGYASITQIPISTYAIVTHTPYSNNKPKTKQIVKSNYNHNKVKNTVNTAPLYNKNIDNIYSGGQSANAVTLIPIKDNKDNSDELYNTRPIVFAANSPEGAFLESENLKFNSGVGKAKDNAKPVEKPSSKQKEHEVYVQTSAKTIVQDYHREPEVAWILGKEIVKEKDDDSWWDKWVHSKSIFGGLEGTKFGLLKNLLISDKTIENPVIREVINNNETINNSFNADGFDKIISDIGNVADGSESTQKMDDELNLLQPELQKNIMDTYTASTTGQVVKALEDEVPEAHVDHETYNSFKTILNYTGEGDKDEK